MKQYPSIPRGLVRKRAIYAFDKLDGSNIRAEWSRKRGFWKFGTRRRLLDISEPIIGKSIPLIQDTYSSPMSKIFKKMGCDRAVSFFEFFGPRSFAGQHDENDPHSVILIDVSIHRRGLLLSREFERLFRSVPTAEVLYYGNANQNLVDAVRESKLNGMTFEGVVCKGEYISPGLPLMFKIKSEAWLERLSRVYAGDEEAIRRLI